MGFLDIFRSRNSPRQQPAVGGCVEFNISGEFIRIESLDFFGPHAVSQNRRYLAAWEDADYQGRKRGTYVGGHRENGNGRVLLLEERKMLYHLDLKRPNDGAVGNNGLVAINDWGFAADHGGTFFVLEKNGAKLIEHRPGDGLLDCGISLEGELAWCTTSQSELSVFTTSPPKLVAKIPGRDKPESLKMNKDMLAIRLHGFDRLYSLAGDLLNAEETEKSERAYLIEHDTGYQLLALGEKLLKERTETGSLQEGDFVELQKLFTVVAGKDISPSFKAKAHRRLAEISQSRGDRIEALKHFTLALEYDPKVGCKKASGRLEKELKTGGPQR